MSSPENDKTKSNFRVVVGLDFGTTYSGFACCHFGDKNKKVYSNDIWHGEAGQYKTNTVLQYDDGYNNVISWGAPALFKRPNRRNRKRNNEGNGPVELFKLCLGDLLDKFKPKLPVEYKRAITDYLEKIGKVIKDTIDIRWPEVDYFKNVLLVITVPAAFPEESKAIMRNCAFKAGLTEEEYSTNLQFTTEPEAAAIHCMDNLKQQAHTISMDNHVLAESESMDEINFMIVDCGGGTVDLTTRKLKNDKLDEITERAGDFCGSSFIDAEFIEYLRKKLGDEPMDLLRDNNYGQMQYLINQFCKHGKIPFTGEDDDFLYELDISDTVPILEQYITDDDVRETLEENEWIIDFDFETMKSIFEPVIQKILRLIEVQLDNAREPVSAMFLVGGFSESKYLQKRIKNDFSHRVNYISVPFQPIAAIARGSTLYGLSMKSNLENDDNTKCVVSSRVLKYTYGIRTSLKWEEGDPPNRRTDDGRIKKFRRLAKRGTKMDINQEVTSSRIPVYPDQKAAEFKIYYTTEYHGKYCDDPDMKLLGTLHIDLPGSGLDRPVLFGLTFGKMEITATSKNELTGQIYKSTFKFNLDD